MDVDYLTLSGTLGLVIKEAGMYQVTVDVEAYQAKRPVTFKLVQKGPGGTTLLKVVDLLPDEPQTVVQETYLVPGDSVYCTLVSDPSIYFGLSLTGSKGYKGQGIALRRMRVEGPVYDQWPPTSTRSLFHSAEFEPIESSEDGPFKVKGDGDQVEQVNEFVAELATRAFRRPATTQELDSWATFSAEQLAQGRALHEVARLAFHSVLTSPQFLMFGGQAGALDDAALANRLSYFLWKSMPDHELSELAAAGKLSDEKVLHAQVERMLADEKSQRFVKDFLGQWLRTYKVDATSPDEKLYPEYDELLGAAILKEPELFFTELIRENLGVDQLIDSDFTFVNRRLAKHYRIRGVKGQKFQKVSLPSSSPRGGVLTQAAILKTTANGTVTSPVTRGNFVLTNFLGTPPSPPPPTIGSIEPDTRGKTTIREILAAHRDNDSCNKCHREIDPPGFALESFDPIGGFRTKYRANAAPSLFNPGRTFKDGLPVDASGVTAAGRAIR